MFLIDTITKSIRAETVAAPIAALPCIVQTNRVSKDMANVPIGPAEITSSINNVAIDIVPVPVDEFQIIDLRYLSIYNPNVETHTINLALYDSSGPTTTRIHRATLKYRWRLEYNYDKGFTIYDDLGGVVSNTATISHFIAQANPGAVLTDIYTATTKTIVNKMIVANRAAVAKTFRLSIAPLGAADAASQYLFYDVSILKNETKEISGPFNLSATDKIRVYGQDNNVTFTINGITES